MEKDNGVLVGGLVVAAKVGKTDISDTYLFAFDFSISHNIKLIYDDKASILPKDRLQCVYWKITIFWEVLNGFKNIYSKYLVSNSFCLYLHHQTENI